MLRAADPREKPDGIGIYVLASTLIALEGMLNRLSRTSPPAAFKRAISAVYGNCPLRTPTAAAPILSTTTSIYPTKSYCSSTTTATKMSSSSSTTPDYLKASHDNIFANNKKWAEAKAKNDPEFFTKLSSGQKPDYLYIGCADSRIPSNEIMGLDAGEVFTHRNIANLVCNTDLNVMSVINYAVRHLEVKHIVVVGHYSCGGVKAAMTPADLGLLNPWLRNIRDVYRLHEQELDAIEDQSKKYDRLAELNVLEQARNVVKTAAVQQSYGQKKFPIVHAWIFDFKDGLLKDLELDFEKQLKDIQKIYNLCG